VTPLVEYSNVWLTLLWEAKLDSNTQRADVFEENRAETTTEPNLHDETSDCKKFPDIDINNSLELPRRVTMEISGKGNVERKIVVGTSSLMPENERKSSARLLRKSVSQA
jgi:hypothetical protein